MVRAGGLFLVLIGAGLLGGMAVSGDALIDYRVFFAGVTLAIVSLMFAKPFSFGPPSRLQIAALAFAIGLEVLLFIVLSRSLPRGTPEETRWLWVSMIVGIHFLPMALSFGPSLLFLGGACIMNAGAGLLFATVPYEVFGTVDGLLKVGVGAVLLATSARDTA